eukprot:m.64365 g.64365  ORF g.64365 m.64365 type:complete len:765 (-) comp11644_c0_seq2:2086-4380(-)
MTSEIFGDWRTKQRDAKRTAPTLFPFGQGSPQSKPLSIDLKAPIDAMSMSPDRTRVIVAGRKLLRIVTSDKDGTELVEQSLGKARSSNVKFCTDVVWHPLESYSHKIATATYNGHIILYDLHHQNRENIVIEAHRGSINEITYNPLETHTLLSAAQGRESTVKRWDTRTRSEAASYKIKDSARSVAWDIHNCHQFAAGLDQGVVQIWDARNASIWISKIPAHSGPVYTLSWHPLYRNRLATGARDTFIHIWDLTKSASTPAVSIQTIASVGRVVWRPEHHTQLASCANIHDYTINVWDLQRPFVPYMSFHRHKLEVSDILWDQHGRHVLLSASKDQTLAVNLVDSAVKPQDEASEHATGVTWGLRGHLCQFSEKPEGSNQPTIPRTPVSASSQNVFGGIFSKEQKEKQISTNLKESLITMQSPLHEIGVLEHLAKGYKFRDNMMTRAEVCSHNAKVAQEAGCPQIEQSWRIIASLVELKESHSDGVESPEDEPQQSKPVEHDDHATATVHDASMGLSAMENVRITDHKSKVQIPIQKEFELTEGNSAVEPTSDLFLPEDDGNTENMEILQPWGAPNTDESPDRMILTDVGQNNHDLIAMGTALVWNMGSQLHVELLEFYSSIDNVQMCVTLILVLGDNYYTDISEQQEAEWFHAYCELLYRMELIIIRTEVINLCRLQEIKDLNTDQTTLSIACGTCQKPLEHGWYCAERCKTFVGRCSICNLPVRSLYVWCQGCSHGGHLEHMREWFKTNKFCPTGCGHQCEF